MSDLFDGDGNVSIDVLGEIADNKKIQSLKNKISKKQKLVDSAKKAYYNTSNPIMTDQEYDALEYEIVSLKEKISKITGEQFDEDDKYQKVGASVEDVKNKFPKAAHNIPMGSQSKCANEDEFRKWWRLLPCRGKILSTYKLDGSSLALYYEDGKLIQAITRGNGKVGRDITPNAVKFSGIPQNIPLNGFVSVRGECVLSVENWKVIDADSPNPRNLGTGIMSREDGKNCNKLDFIAFDISTDRSQIKRESDKIDILGKLGFATTPSALFDNIDDLIDYYKMISNMRKDSAVEINIGKHIWIDGLVIKLDDVNFQEKLGESSGRPKWSTALKFESPGETTYIIGVEFSVGHTGAITPVAHVKEVKIGGTKVKRVTLNNWDYIDAKDVAVGDKVKIVKGGDIIPKLVAVLGRPNNRKIISKPTKCPVCGGNVGKDSNVDGSSGAVTKCLNNSCKAKAVGRFKRIVKKLEILEMGDSIIKAMHEAGILVKMGDLFRLERRKDAIAKLNVGNGVWGEKRTQKIIDEINEHRKMTLDLFLGCLGINGLGQRRAKIIIESAGGKLNTIDDWKSEILLKIADKVGVPQLAKNIQKSFNEMINDIEDMQQVVAIKDVGQKVLSGVLSGKSFVLTGTMSKGRKEIAKGIEAAGGEVHSSISKNITYLVQADPTKESTKSKKADKLGIQIISEEDLYDMIKDNKNNNVVEDNKDVHF